MTDRRDKSGPWVRDEYAQWSEMDQENKVCFFPYGSSGHFKTSIELHKVVVKAMENMMKVRNC